MQYVQYLKVKNEHPYKCKRELWLASYDLLNRNTNYPYLNVDKREGREGGRGGTKGGEGETERGEGGTKGGEGGRKGGRGGQRELKEERGREEKGEGI